MDNNDINTLCKKLIYSIARKYSYSGNDLEDLYQVGALGLSKAIKNYKSDKSAKFTSYAHFYIEGEIIKYVRENRMIKVKQDLYNLNKEIVKAKEYLEQKYLKSPTISEIAFFLSRSEDEIMEAMESVQSVKSLDYNLNDNDFKEVNLYDYNSYHEKMYDEDILMVRDEVRNLSDYERNLIIKRYYEDKSQLETSKDLGISQVQVSRCESKILKKMKANIMV